LELQYQTYDSTGRARISIDTLNLVKKPELQAKGFHFRKNRGNPTESKEENSKKKAKRLSLSNNMKNPNGFDLNRTLDIISSTPAYKIKSEKIKMFRIEDTLQFPVKIDVYHDTSSMYKFCIRYKPEEKMKYKILIPDSTITDIYGTTNDTTIISYKTQSEDFYGTLKVRISHIKGPVILQLLDDKENLIMEKFFNSDRMITYDYLYPHKYILKLIVDSNDNGKWDTGDYLKKLQPERVIYFPQIINIRSNWEVDNTWDLEY
jgi:hypothetical protein